MIIMATKRKKWKSINKIVMSRIESSADEEFCNAEVFSGAESSGASNDSPYREQNQCDESGEDNATDEEECCYAITDSDSEESYFGSERRITFSCPLHQKLVFSGVLQQTKKSRQNGSLACLFLN